jgi:hypothetical protein
LVSQEVYIFVSLHRESAIHNHEAALFECWVNRANSLHFISKKNLQITFVLFFSRGNRLPAKSFYCGPLTILDLNI